MSIIKKVEDQRTVDLMALARILLRKLHFIVLWTVLFGALAYGRVHFFVTPTYRAGVTLYVNNAQRTNNSGNISSADLYASARLVQTYAAIITSNAVLDKVIEQAGLQGVLSAGALASSMSVSSVNDTEVFRVTVTHPDPKIAMRAANAIATVAPEQLTEIIEGGTTRVVDYARLPKAPTSPNAQRTILVGVMLGLLLSSAFFVLRALMDTSVKRTEDFANWDYPLLASIPDLEEATAQHGGYGYGYRQRTRK